MLYWILRSEDYSLLMGSLLLFGVLAILMIATRRIDWSNVARLKRASEVRVTEIHADAERGGGASDGRVAFGTHRIEARARGRRTGSRASSGRPESKGGAGAYSMAS